jgi:hypothetical protein
MKTNKVWKASEGIRWKIREGSYGPTDQDTAKLLIDIFSALEEEIKREFQ